MFPQVSKLAGMDADSEMPGELRWEVGYFGKPQWRPELRTDGKDRNLPSKLQDDKTLQDEKGTLDSPDADAVAHTPPDPLWPSGICSVIVHQIVNLELENIKGTQGSRKGREYEPAKASGEATEEESKNLPTSYCTILYNDNLVYRTRAKAISSKPIFNAGTERFLRDWRSGIITITVRDQRYREHDPILGVVPLKLSDILQTSSQVTRWYPLDGGIGFGRIRISLLFRSIETHLPPNMLGWDVGTFEFQSERILALGYAHITKLKLRTGGSTGVIPRTDCKKLDEGDGVYWDVARKEGKHNVVLPVKHRYRSPVVFEFHSSGHRGAVAYAQIWLQHLTDNEDTPIDIPIWTTKNGNRLTQNYITEDNFSAKEVPGLEDLKEVGRLQFRARFKSGTDESHRAFVTDSDSRETFETWAACLSEGVRERMVPQEVPDRVQTLHDESLTSGRDILKAASEEEKQLWLTKSGTDWSGAFGHDPKAYMDRRGRKIAEPGTDRPPHDPFNPSSDEDDEGDYQGNDDSSSDLGVTDATNSSTKKRSSMDTNRSGMAGYSSIDGSPTSKRESNKLNKDAEKRKHRGLMQWKPARNAAFAKHQAQHGINRIKRRFSGSLGGREPGVETETGT
jgi:C2 domain